MRTKVLLFALVAMSLSVMLSCGSKATGNDDAQTDDESEETVNYSPDLAMNELKGSVKSCRVFNYHAVKRDSDIVVADKKLKREYTLSFSKKGVITCDEYYIYTYDSDGSLKMAKSVDMPQTFGTIKRNKKGEIVSIKNKNELDEMGNWDRKIKWNANGQIDSISTAYWEWDVKESFKYDDKGFVAQSGCFYDGDDGEDVDIDAAENSSYDYVAVDEQGNWTERRVITDWKRWQTVDVPQMDAKGNPTGDSIEKKTLINSEIVYAIQKREIAYY